MSLPTQFLTPEQYFEESLNFFQTYQNLFKYPNTEVLCRGILDHIDVNPETIDLKDETNLEGNNEFLIKFSERIKSLQVFHLSDGFDDTELPNINAPLGVKKTHEIVNLAREIKELCNDTNCDVVVDLGCGLGYLDQLLYESTNYKVLGLECNESHYVGAKKRQRKYHENSIQDVKYIRHTVSENSHENIRGFLENKFANFNRFCLTGLHACADLTIDALNLFLKMKDATSLVLMPCCYHKMALKDNKFKSFPLSKCLKDICEKLNAEEYLNVPFLRLGAQPPILSDTLEDSVFNLLSRAVLEQYVRTNNCKLKRNKRKAVKMKTMANDFEHYIRDAARCGFSLISESSVVNNSVEFNIKELNSLWREIDDLKKIKAAIFILIQRSLQPVIENFIFYDRLVYLKENGIEHCKVKKIFDETLSPRCLAMLAYK